jgi:hypothetical protein
MGWVKRLGSTARLQRRSIPAARACFSWTKEGMCYDSIALLLPIKALSRLSHPPHYHTHSSPPISRACVSFVGRGPVSDVSCIGVGACVWVLEAGCRTVAGTCGVPGYMDGAPLTAMFNSPQGLAISPDGEQLLIADTVNNLIRSVGACENVPCQLGSWRGDCDVIYMGRCVPCTKSINSTVTKAADPFNQDTCKWECSVGHWQYDRAACTLGDKSCARCRPCSLKLPRNASFSTNGGFEDKCQWTCNAGFELNAAGNGCDLIPLSRCFETSRVSQKGSFCAGQNLTVKGCAPNSEV